MSGRKEQGLLSSGICRIVKGWPRAICLLESAVESTQLLQTFFALAIPHKTSDIMGHIFHRDFVQQVRYELPPPRMFLSWLKHAEA